MSVQSIGDEDEYDAAIVGYGWAAYALRRTDGSIEYFEGWEGHSTATSTQMGKLRRVLDEEGAEWETVDQQPEYGRRIEWRRGMGDTTVR